MLDTVPLQPQLKSPKMVAAVLSSCYRYQPSREVVKRRREQFERGFSDSCLLAKNCRLHRGRSADSFRPKHLNEAQRLVKYRSSTSLLSLDSGLSSKDGSANTSANTSYEDLRPSYLSRSSSNEKLRLRQEARRLRSSTSNSSVSSNRSSPEPKTAEPFLKTSATETNYINCTSSSTSKLCLPDLLPSSPPPVPPKSRPPLPPRRRTDSLNSSQQSSVLSWDADSEGSSDISLPEYSNDLQIPAKFSSLIKESIPHTFVHKESLYKFLCDIGYSCRSEVVVQSITGGVSGNLALKATVTGAPASPCLSPCVRTLTKQECGTSNATEIQV